MLTLRQVEVLQGQGMGIAEAVRQIGMSQQTYYRWRKQYGGMNRDQLKRLNGCCPLPGNALQSNGTRGGNDRRRLWLIFSACIATAQINAPAT